MSDASSPPPTQRPLTEDPEDAAEPTGPAADEAAISGGEVSRRSFIQTLGVSAAAGAWAGHEDSRATAATAQPDDVDTFGPNAGPVTLTVNGQRLRTEIEPQTTLMEALRWHLELTGTKEVCDRGACGGCSVLVDGKLVASCMMLAADARDAQVTTIEGLGNDGELTALQDAFVKHDALQCGYCTPGLVVAAHALLRTTPQPSLDEIKAGLSGNICRCGTYSNIFNAVLEASGQPPIADPNGGGQ